MDIIDLAKKVNEAIRDFDPYNYADNYNDTEAGESDVFDMLDEGKANELKENLRDMANNSEDPIYNELIEDILNWEIAESLTNGFISNEVYEKIRWDEKLKNIIDDEIIAFNNTPPAIENKSLLENERPLYEAIKNALNKDEQLVTDTMLGWGQIEFLTEQQNVKNAECVANIQGIEFYSRKDNPTLIITYNENYHIKNPDNIRKECDRIFRNYYKDDIQNCLQEQSKQWQEDIKNNEKNELDVSNSLTPEEEAYIDGIEMEIDFGGSHMLKQEDMDRYNKLISKRENNAGQQKKTENSKAKHNKSDTNKDEKKKTNKEQER